LASMPPRYPSPKEIAELPKKAATDVLYNIKVDIVSTMAAEVAKAASWLLGKTLDAITGSTTPDVTSRWFVGQYAQMAGPAPLFAIPFLVLAASQSIATTDWGILARGLRGHGHAVGPAVPRAGRVGRHRPAKGLPQPALRHAEVV